MALDGLPNFKCMPGVARIFAARCRFRQRRVHGESIRRGEVWALVLASVHRHGDSNAHRYVACASGQHILSCFVQYAPYKLAGAGLGHGKEKFGDNVVNTIAEYAPNIKDIILHRQVVTPLDMERTWGLTEATSSRASFHSNSYFSCGRWLDGRNSGRDQEFVYVRIGDASGGASWARRDGWRRSKF